MELTKEEFINRVYNYEANPNEWKYEGDKPCIVDFHATWCALVKCWLRHEEINQEYNGQIIFTRLMWTNLPNWLPYSEFAVYLRCCGSPWRENRAFPRERFQRVSLNLL